MRAAFVLDPSLTFLNHGSFGACPRAVLEHQAALRSRLEADPVNFLMRDLEGLLDAALKAVGQFIVADARDLGVVRNATEAVNAVVQGLKLAPGDELLTTDQGYNACTNALRHAADRAGARVVVAAVPFPLAGPQQVSDAVLGAVTARTRFALIDHLTSPTALVWPVAELTRVLEARGVAVMLDGAHAPGSVELNLDALGASFATGNLHKWVCAPKGAAYLHVRRDRQAGVRPLVVSHGANAQRTDRSRFRLEFDWQGTSDPTAFLSVPKAIEVVGAMMPGGWPEVRRRNHQLAVAGRALLHAAIGSEPAAPESMLAAMGTVVLPRPASGPGALPGGGQLDPLQEALFREHHIEVPVFTFAGQRCLRVSAHLHNQLADYQKLAHVLPGLL